MGCYLELLCLPSSEKATSDPKGFSYVHPRLAGAPTERVVHLAQYERFEGPLALQRRAKYRPGRRKDTGHPSPVG
jgi:hypothetical protein